MGDTLPVAQRLIRASKGNWMEMYRVTADGFELLLRWQVYGTVEAMAKYRPSVGLARVAYA